MKSRNVSQEAIESILKDLDMVTESGFTQEGRFLRFHPQPTNSRAKYARKSAPMFNLHGEVIRKGRRLKALCSHGWRDLIFALFNAGANRINTSQGKWESKGDFTRELYDLFCVNVGSRMFPVEMRELCEHDASHLETV